MDINTRKIHPIGPEDELVHLMTKLTADTGENAEGKQTTQQGNAAVITTFACIYSVRLQWQDENSEDIQ